MAALAHQGLHALEVGGAAAGVDVAPVGLGGEHVDVRTEAAEDLRRRLVGRAVGAVEQDVEPMQVEVGEALAQLAQVVVERAMQRAYVADALRDGMRRCLEAPLDGELDLVGQLEAVGAEELDPVVAIGIVRGAEHDGDVEPVAPQE